MEPQKTPANQMPQSDTPVGGTDGSVSSVPPIAGVVDESNPEGVSAPGVGDQSPSESGGGLAQEAEAGQTFKPEMSMAENTAVNDPSSEPSVMSGGMPIAETQDTPTNAEISSMPLPPEITPSPLPVSSPKRGKKGLIIGLIVAAVLLLISGGAAASYYYIANKPENVLKQALANAVDTYKSKTVHFNGNVSMEEKSSETTVDVDFKGEADSNTSAVSLNGSMDLLVTELTFDLRTLDSKTFYARVGGLEGVPELLALAGDEAAGYAPLVSSLNDQWIEINESLIKQIDSSYESSQVSEADTQKVVEAYANNPFLVVDEVLPEETVAGENCYHYKLLIEPTKLKAFFAAIKDIKSLNFTQEMLDEANRQIDEADFKSYPLEVWISKGDKMFKQFAMKFEDQDARVNVRVTVDSYNKPVNIQKPEDAKSLMEVMSGLLTGGLTMPTSLEDQSGISL